MRRQASMMDWRFSLSFVQPCEKADGAVSIKCHFA